MPAYRTVEYRIALFIMSNYKTASLLMFSIKMFIFYSALLFPSNLCSLVKQFMFTHIIK